MNCVDYTEHSRLSVIYNEQVFLLSTEFPAYSSVLWSLSWA